MLIVLLLLSLFLCILHHYYFFFFFKYPRVVSHARAEPNFLTYWRWCWWWWWQWWWWWWNRCYCRYCRCWCWYVQVYLSQTTANVLQISFLITQLSPLLLFSTLYSCRLLYSLVHSWFLHCESSFLLVTLPSSKLVFFSFSFFFFSSCSDRLRHALG